MLTRVRSPKKKGRRGTSGEQRNSISGAAPSTTYVRLRKSPRKSEYLVGRNHDTGIISRCPCGATAPREAAPEELRYLNGTVVEIYGLPLHRDSPGACHVECRTGRNLLTRVTLARLAKRIVGSTVCVRSVSSERLYHAESLHDCKNWLKQRNSETQKQGCPRVMHQKHGINMLQHPLAH